ncbi:uncharacterized protein LOC141606764 [Silene latifolia]|uniref:uncharacterized protein LOC141606764 n=1 Tax=Silene latifolia TaxID=37657 RepID=UPI003D772981
MGLKKIRLSSVHLYGRAYRVSRNTTYWDMAKRMAKETSVSHQHLMDSPARYVRLLKAYCWSVKGLMFKITFRVKGENGVSVAYTAQVWSNICKRPFQVFTFDKVPGSERKPKDWEINGSNNSDKKVSTKKMGMKGLDLFKGLSSSVAMTKSELDCRNDTGKLRTHAFYVLLEQIRSQRSWSYSRVRKSASTIWKKLPESEKMIFLGGAAKRIENK